jgi:hypothetical protein
MQLIGLGRKKPHLYLSLGITVSIYLSSPNARWSCLVSKRWISSASFQGGSRRHHFPVRISDLISFRYSPFYAVPELALASFVGRSTRREMSRSIYGRPTRTISSQQLFAWTVLLSNATSKHRFVIDEVALVISIRRSVKGSERDGGICAEVQSRPESA